MQAALTLKRLGQYTRDYKIDHHDIIRSWIANINSERFTCDMGKICRAMYGELIRTGAKNLTSFLEFSQSGENAYSDHVETAIVRMVQCGEIHELQFAGDISLEFRHPYTKRVKAIKKLPPELEEIINSSAKAASSYLKN